MGQSSLFTLLTKAERSTGRQEGSEAILHGRIVCVSDGRAYAIKRHCERGGAQKREGLQGDDGDVQLPVWRGGKFQITGI